ncbi:MAG: sulfatase [Opitutaceae bacterium]|nr:sulfatase [Opitutaceae bacterium]|tara:strand:+ start:1278 stop:2714 length:1437 start_codon:yes stop_codon:yes gene_type:complete
MSKIPKVNPISRRDALKNIACGFGYMAAASMAQQSVQAAIPNPLAPKMPHTMPKAKRVIFLFMAGGVSQVDSYDYKPLLYKKNGDFLDFTDQRILAKTGMGSNQRVMQPLWDFKQHGENGAWVSELFPHMAKHTDDYCLIRSMQTEGVAHGPATLFLHTGSTNLIRPSMGAWVNYGLGTENQDMPGFVSLSPSFSNGGPRNYGNAFLPSAYQGTAIGRAGMKATNIGINNLTNFELSSAQQKRQFDLLQAMNHEQCQDQPVNTELEAVINSYELAWRMQANAPEVLDISKESEAMKKLYGIDEEPTDNYGRQCLMARRMAEAGVRFIQVNYSDNSNNPAWDQHTDMPKHKDNALAVDKPISGLLTDLKQRGLLEDTLVWWGGEFGRTPYAEKNSDGRDHNRTGFTVWLAGGGVRPGLIYGETDEFGQYAVNKKVHMHDLHATILHLLGMDHKQLTYRHEGRDFRLTDVFGDVVHDIIA